ncbi:hypothetical protein GLAREA_07552 [Glarea lozoyensis ATCC 20868]|uniref:Uncharacterized protein n=1 Tax=Glarea lozoyensis (strain ATCC 20868 / MF5171) TaxID=1116229 RepID=S3D5M2_GLAL2|nr:uncharacterized protein GLAREA_07552 [Glarea lozoyensis ATCC 20868]EPE32419.1 hypothetical protein GLAREA_07552 [Glarea lozoyensis ATCC 20868]
MDSEGDDEILKTFAAGNDIDHDQWPALLSRLIPRLEKIANTAFPPRPFLASQPSSSHPIPSSPPATQSTNAESSSQNSTNSTDAINKENAPPPPKPPAHSLSPSIQTFLESIISTLRTLFSQHPPHTIQRLAELILYPRQHYKTVSSYLHAVDRVVHVSSGSHIFPLPPAVPDPSSASVLSNGTIDPLSTSWGNVSSVQANLGSDESLGGALLTPIPWLTNNKNGGSQHSGGSRSPIEREVKTESTEMIEGPNGLGGIETVTVSVNGISSTRESTLAAAPTAPTTDVAAELRAEGGVTQGELLRQEQRAGVVPVAQLSSNRGDTDGLGEEDEAPHARGPDEIGMEDTGPQASGHAAVGSGLNVSMKGIDVDAAVGRKEVPVSPKRDADEEIGGQEKKVKDGDEEMGDEVELVDVDGRKEGEGVGEKGENKGVDAVDGSGV